MTTKPNPTPEEIATGIVGLIRLAFLELNADMSVGGLAKHNEAMREACDSIAAAVRDAEDRGWAKCCMDAERKAPPGHILTDTGEVLALPEGHVAVREGGKVVVRKCESPLTADGLLVRAGMTLYFKSGVKAAVLAVWFDGTLDLQSHDSDGIPVNNWKRLRVDRTDAYSTREAAEAAAKSMQEPTP